MGLYLVYILMPVAISGLVFFLWRNSVPTNVKDKVISWFDSLKPGAQCHIKTNVQLVITLFFSLLPAILIAMSKGSQSVNWMEVLISDLKSGSVFVYTPAFLAQFFILTFTHDFKDSGKISLIYKLILSLSFYSCFMGAMTYAGFIDRGIFDFGEDRLSLPSTVDWSVIIATLISWYYCTYKVAYIPKDSKEAYREQEEKARKKFDEVIKRA